MRDSAIYQKYVASFYWITQTIVTVGYGDVPAVTMAEKCLAIVAMFAGVIFFSLTVGSLTSILSEADAKNSLLESKMRLLDQIVDTFGVKDFKLLKKITLAIKLRIYSSEEQFEELIDMLPKKQAVSLSKLVYEPMVTGIKFFSTIEPELLLAVAPHLLPAKFSAHEVIFTQGEYANEVYFIKSGSVGLIIPDHPSEVFSTIPQGSYFGETDIIFNTARKFTVTAIAPVELLALERKYFVKIFFKEFKDHGRTVKQYAEKRLIKQLKALDIYSQILKEHNERRLKLGTSPSTAARIVNEKIDAELVPYLKLDTMMEVDVKFSPSFLERNKSMVPAKFGRKDEEDILLENVSLLLTKNDKLPKFVKDMDTRFLEVEKKLRKVLEVIGQDRDLTQTPSPLAAKYKRLFPRID